MTLFFMSEDPKEIILDIPAEVVEDVQEEVPQMTDKQLRKFQRDRVTQINRVLKNIRRREKNPLTVVRKMDNK